MTITDFYNDITRLTDTDTLKIGASETKRVLAVMFSVLVKMDSADAAMVIAKGLELAKKKAAK